MRRFHLAAMLASAVSLSHCKTFDASTEKSWVENGSEAKATAHIVDIISRQYGEGSPLVKQAQIRGVPPRHAVIQAFAKQLQDAKVEQTETRDYVASMAGNPQAPESFESYVIQEFTIRTNYLEYLSNEKLDLQLIDPMKLQPPLTGT